MTVLRSLHRSSGYAEPLIGADNGRTLSQATALRRRNVSGWMASFDAVGMLVRYDGCDMTTRYTRNLRFGMQWIWKSWFPGPKKPTGM